MPEPNQFVEFAKALKAESDARSVARYEATHKPRRSRRVEITIDSAFVVGGYGLGAAYVTFFSKDFSSPINNILAGCLFLFLSLLLVSVTALFKYSPPSR